MPFFRTTALLCCSDPHGILIGLGLGFPVGFAEGHAKRAGSEGCAFREAQRRTNQSKCG
jgi:hypothetical protein